MNEYRKRYKRAGEGHLSMVIIPLLNDQPDPFGMLKSDRVFSDYFPSYTISRLILTWITMIHMYVSFSIVYLYLLLWILRKFDFAEYQFAKIHIKKKRSQINDNDVAITAKLIDIFVASVEFTLSQVECTTIPLRDPPMMLLWALTPSVPPHSRSPNNTGAYCRVLCELLCISAEASALNKYNKYTGWLDRRLKCTLHVY